MNSIGSTILFAIVLAVGFGVGWGLHPDGPDVEDVDHHMRIVFDVTNGTAIRPAKDVIVRKDSCYDGDPTRNCVFISCPVQPECPECPPEESDDVATE